MKKLIFWIIRLSILLILLLSIYIYHDNHRVTLLDYPIDMDLSCYHAYEDEERDWLKGKLPYKLLICSKKNDNEINVFILKNSITNQQYKAVKVRGKIEINSTDYSIAAVETMFNLLDKDGSPTRICFPYPTYPTFEEWKPFAQQHEGGSDEELKRKYEFILKEDLKCRNDRI